MTVESFIALIKRGFSLDHIYILSRIEQGEDISGIWISAKGKLLIQALTRKGLLDGENKVTLAGRQLINLFNNIKVGVVSLPVLETVLPNKEVELSGYIERLHKSLSEKLNEITGKKQIVGFGNTYFIPSKGELKLFLPRFIKNHKDLWDEDKVEKMLLNFVSKCAKSKHFAPAVKYFIYHSDRGSALASALEDYENNKHEDTNTSEERAENYIDYGENG